MKIKSLESFEATNEKKMKLLGTSTMYIVESNVPAFSV